MPDRELSAAVLRQGIGIRTGAASIEDVDGARLLATSVAFGRELRANGLPIDLGAAIDFARALSLVDIGDRVEVKAAGATVFIRRHEDLEIYDAVFERFWRARRPPLPITEVTSLLPASPDTASSDEAEDMDSSQRAGVQPRPSPLAPTPAGDSADDRPIDGIVVAPDAYSFGELIRHKEFERMTQAELRDAERLVDLLRPKLELRRTRRQELHDHGRILAPRAMYRRNLATGGDLVQWVWRRRIRRPRPLVVMCDISGSMERQSRLLLRFVQALSGSAVRAEAFVFSTRLTRVTRILRDRDRDRAMAKVSDAVSDWAGGTRIGEAIRTFNQHWARRVLRSGAVVVIVSDGWDRGDPTVVSTEMARLQRSCYRLVWLNPLAGAPGYQPLAAGMQAAYPYIDDFLPAGTVGNLERLGQILAGNAPGRVNGRPHRRAGGRQIPKAGIRSEPRRLQPGKSAAAPPQRQRLGAWASPAARSAAAPANQKAAVGATAETTAEPAPPTSRPVALGDQGDPAAPRVLA